MSDSYAVNLPGVLTLREGESLSQALRFRGLTDDRFSYRYDVTDGTATAADYNGSSGSGYISIFSTSPRNRTEYISIAALRDGTAERVETAYLTVTLSGTMQFADGRQTQVTRIDIIDDNLSTGTQKADVLRGTSEAETLMGLGGNDTYYVTAGDLVVEAADGGFDRVFADIDHVLAGQVENLILTGTSAIDGAGNALANRISGNAAANRLDGFAGFDTLLGGAGDDTIYGNNGNDTLAGGEGADDLYGGGHDDVLWGGAGDDRLYGQVGDDLLHGQTGNDLLGGGGGDDTLFGNKGNDTLAGADGADEIFGGNDEDVLWGGNGHDKLYGQAGNDLLHGQVGNDLLGGAGGNDTLFGNDGNDTLAGADGADQLHGGNHADVLWGGNGGDRLLGQAGIDRLHGQAGNDKLIGGLGADILAGGTGIDHFVFTSTADSGVAALYRDTVTDFRQAQSDRLDLRGIDADTGATGNQAFDFIGQSGFSGDAGQVRFRHANGNTIVAGDVDGDGRSDFAVLLQGQIDLTGSDFFL